MERKKEEQELKQVKILKCEKCGEEYLFDSTSRICPQCKGALTTQIVTK
ncbi:MAG: YgiT-type zinc finger protein [Chloroflexi bacterium]|nr:YgiT-type zinc finger protein [Chloroflexota bacterium]